MNARVTQRAGEMVHMEGPVGEQGPAVVARGEPLESAPVPLIRHARLFFELEPLEPARLPPYLGSTLRGGLMRALRGVACVARGVKVCARCPFLHACTYALLFETPRPGWATRYPTMKTVVHPLVIEPDAREGPGAGITFAVRLFGRAVTTVPFVIEAARRMAYAGLGRARARFVLVRVRDRGPDGEVVFSAEDPAPRLSVEVVEGAMPAEDPDPRRVMLVFRTPTRLVEDSVLLRRPTLSALVQALAFRASAMAYFHGQVDWTPDRGGLSAAVSEVRPVASDIAWVPQSRFSTRQEQKVPLDGFVGWVTYEGAGLPALLPLLRLGEVLHVGKGTVFGLGEYRIESEATG